MNVKNYSLKADRFTIECIPYGDDPFCVAYVDGKAMVTLEDWETAWACKKPEGIERFTDLMYWLHGRLSVYFDDVTELNPMIDTRNYDVSDLSFEEEPKEATSVEAPMGTPGDEWCQSWFKSLDAAIGSVRREREEKMDAIVSSLEEERKWLKAELEFYIPKTHGQMDLFSA